MEELGGITVGAISRTPFIAHLCNHLHDKINELKYQFDTYNALLIGFLCLNHVGFTESYPNFTQKGKEKWSFCWLLYFPCWVRSLFLSSRHNKPSKLFFNGSKSSFFFFFYSISYLFPQALYLLPLQIAIASKLFNGLLQQQQQQMSLKTTIFLEFYSTYIGPGSFMTIFQLFGCCSWGPLLFYVFL